MSRIEGSGASQLVQLIRTLGQNTDVTLELATVTSAPPSLKIKVDNMAVELDKDDLLVSQSLTKHKRKMNIKTDKGFTTDVTVPIVEHGLVFVGQGTLTPKSFALKEANMTVKEAEVEFVDELKKDDRVLVAGFQQGQIYVILDRVVTY